MQRFKGKLLFSAGDLNTFIGCRHATRLTFERLNMEAPPPIEEDEFSQFVAARGIAFEQEYLAKLKGQYGDNEVHEISAKGSPHDRAEATRTAIEAGYRVIYQAQLMNDSWNGIADFLVRQEEVSDGKWVYDIQDTKLALSVKPSHAIQLAVYADLLQAAQTKPPGKLSVVLGSYETQTIEVREVIHYTRDASRRFEEFMRQLEAGTATPTEAEPCAYCRNCIFSATCKDVWQKADHLSLVAGMRKEQITKLRAAGIHTLEALANSQGPVPRMVPGTYAKLRQQAALQLKGCDQPVYHILAAETGRGFGRLPEPGAGDVFFDMEGDPLFPGGSLEYLFGAYTREHGFRAFWARDRAEERVAFDQFMRWLDVHLQQHPQAFVYHYNHYETTALGRLAGTYGLHEELFARLHLTEQRFVDLYKVVREQLMVGEPGYSLKNLERFYRGVRGEEVANAGDSVVKFEAYCITGDNQLLSQIEEYNKVDCESTYGLRDWLLTLRNEADNPPSWFIASSSEPPQKKKDHAMKAQELDRQLATLGLHDDLRALVISLCGFYEREDKIWLREEFERMERPLEELIEDRECLAGLTAHGQQREEGRSFVQDYRFPEQITRRRVDERPKDVRTRRSVGIISALDHAERIVTLKRAKRVKIDPGQQPTEVPMPQSLSLGPPPPPDDGRLEAAIFALAQSMTEPASQGGSPQHERFRASKSILRRELPRLTGEVQSLRLPNEGTVDAAIRSVSHLDHSHMIIQGPPGTGKTFTASRCAVALMQQGRRVAVSSNSHRAINNLLEGIEKAALERDFPFRGLRQPTSSEDDTFSGRFIRTKGTWNEEGIIFDRKSALLEAGTAFYFSGDNFSDTDHEPLFDIMFVDEAGQVSLANLLVLGMVAKSIVLIGDQQQLPQPVQAIHPHGAGVSGLDHLLRGAATVPPERGILLDTTYRMHPRLCGWVSERFYAGALNPADGTELRVLCPELGGSTLPAQGIYFVPVEHMEPRSQESVEEAQKVAELVATLLTTDWQDRNGSRRMLGAADILIVAPYNAQVSVIREELERRRPDMRGLFEVGTVDKFQGREAAVSIVSMTATSREYAPRGLGFVLNPNRLNVAVSRAQSLAIVLGSPALLETECGSLEEVRLVNNLSHAAAISEISRAIR